MSEFLNHSQFFNEAVLLNEAQRKDPVSVFREFFVDYRLSDIRHMLDEIQEVCLTTDHPPFGDPTRRSDNLLFERNLTIVLEAAFILANVKPA